MGPKVITILGLYKTSFCNPIESPLATPPSTPTFQQDQQIFTFSLTKNPNQNHHTNAKNKFKPSNLHPHRRKPPHPPQKSHLNSSLSFSLVSLCPWRPTQIITENHNTTTLQDQWCLNQVQKNKVERREERISQWGEEKRRKNRSVWDSIILLKLKLKIFC